MTEINTNKVVVTSIGISLPIGFKLEDLYNYLRNSDIHMMTNIEDEKLLNALAQYTDIDFRRLDHLSLIAIIAASACFKGAKLAINDLNKENIGGVFSTVFGPVSSARNFIFSGFNNKNGITNASPILFPYTVGNAASGVITILMKAIGFNTTLNSDSPISYAYEIIRRNKAIALLAGGYEEIPKEVQDAFAERTITINNSKISSPITHLTEGSAMLFLENENFAKERNANILFEICGTSVKNNIQTREISIDNFGFIDSDTIYKTMYMTLKTSKVENNQISLIVSLSRDDSNQTNSELEAISRIWKNLKVPIFYVKKVIGETFGANDSFAIIAAYLKLKEMKEGKGESKYALINSYHMGGNCFSLIIKI